MSYAFAIGPHLFTGRKNVPQGPFWMGSAGFAVNAIAVLLIVFFNIMFCFRESNRVRKHSQLLTPCSQHTYTQPLNQP